MLHRPFDNSNLVTRKTPVAVTFAVAALVALLVAAINPVGYVGSGADDEQYLAAARCWVSSGEPCRPSAHWWTRWPAFAPIALFSWWLGESRLSVGIGPGVYWVGALGLTGWLGTLWFGWRAGAIAIVLLGATPVVAAFAFDPNVDLAELTFQVGALVAATYAYRRGSRAMALTAGVVAALALQARDTSALFILVSAGAWLLLDTQKRLVLLWTIPGLIGTMLGEMLVYFLATGDPLFRYGLALGHTNIPSFELPAGFQSSRGPLFNPDYIRSWKREAQITVWWPVDPWLNLLASARSAGLALTAILSLAFLRKHLPRAQRRGASIILAAAVAIALMLVYALAIDPKPRMFMNLWAALAILSGAALSAGLKSEARPLALTLLVLPIALGFYVMRVYPASASAERRAQQWIANYGSDIELDKGAASYLTLLPEARALQSRGAGRRFLIVTSNVECRYLIRAKPNGATNGRVVDMVVGSQPRQGYFCLFEYLPARASAPRGTLATPR